MRKELELYLHIPFCRQKCRYCDFLSFQTSEDVHQAYVKKLLKEISVMAKKYEDFLLTTIFIGGGTPSVLSAALMYKLLKQIFSCFHVQPGAEITVECNPGTLNAEKIRCYRELGVNRLSIGLQSADGRELQLLGRIHTYEQFVSNYDLAREMGFDNINVDIMMSIPGQTVYDYENTLQKVAGLGPEHISAYSLIIEEGTPFFEMYALADQLREQGKPQSLLPSEDEDRNMYVRTKELLKSAGYDRYEISNYAKEGFSCRHNIGYWTRKEYLGVGLGAASLVGSVRFQNPTVLDTYMELEFAWADANETDQPYAFWHQNVELLSRKAQMEEFMFLGLRMMCGVSAEQFYQRFSQTLEEVYGEVICRQLSQNLLKKTKTGYCLTEYGIDVSNYAMAEYLFD